MSFVSDRVFLLFFYTVRIVSVSVVFSFNWLSLFWCGKEGLEGRAQESVIYMSLHRNNKLLWTGDLLQSLRHSSTMHTHLKYSFHKTHKLQVCWACFSPLLEPGWIKVKYYLTLCFSGRGLLEPAIIANVRKYRPSQLTERNKFTCTLGELMKVKKCGHVSDLLWSV